MYIKRIVCESGRRLFGLTVACPGSRDYDPPVRKCPMLCFVNKHHYTVDFLYANNEFIIATRMWNTFSPMDIKFCCREMQLTLIGSLQHRQQPEFPNCFVLGPSKFVSHVPAAQVLGQFQFLPLCRIYDFII